MNDRATHLRTQQTERQVNSRLVQHSKNDARPICAALQCHADAPAAAARTGLHWLRTYAERNSLHPTHNGEIKGFPGGTGPAGSTGVRSMNTTSKTTVTKLSTGRQRLAHPHRRRDLRRGRLADRSQADEQHLPRHRAGGRAASPADADHDRRGEAGARSRAATTTPEGAAQALTLGQYAETWLERRLATMNPQGQTKRGYQALFRLYVLPAFGHLSAGRADARGHPLLLRHPGAAAPGRVRARAATGTPGRAAPGGRMGPQDGHQDLAEAEGSPRGRGRRQACSTARSCATSAAGCRRHDSVGDVRALDDEQTQRLLRAAQGHPLGGVIRFALFTGCRRGEICALRWQNVHLDGRGRRGARSPRRSRTISHACWVKEPKTKASKRKIVIGAKLAAELAVRKREHEARVRAARARTSTRSACSGTSSGTI